MSFTDANNFIFFFARCHDLHHFQVKQTILIIFTCIKTVSLDSESEYKEKIASAICFNYFHMYLVLLQQTTKWISSDSWIVYTFGCCLFRQRLIQHIQITMITIQTIYAFSSLSKCKCIHRWKIHRITRESHTKFPMFE